MVFPINDEKGRVARFRLYGEGHVTLDLYMQHIELNPGSMKYSIMIGQYGDLILRRCQKFQSLKIWHKSNIKIEMN